MHSMLIALNVAVLAALLVLLIGEEVRFRQFKRRVEATRESLGQLAHQIRTPLTNLRKYLSFLQSHDFGTLTIAQQEAVHKMEVALGEGVVLIDRLLAQSRIEEGGMAASPVTLNAMRSVEAAISALKPLADERGHRVLLRGQGQWFPVRADPLLLHGILDEILLNAIAYTPTKGTITVTVAQAGNTVAIRVKDTGIGILPAEKRRIFEKFFRGDRAAAMYAGNGLGLSFASEFARRCGGSVRFISAEKKGSTFTVSLPRAKK